MATEDRKPGRNEVEKAVRDELEGRRCTPFVLVAGPRYAPSVMGQMPALSRSDVPTAPMTSTIRS